ncbi:hypothetical protein BsWGS_26344 [Bradybaena similaris]
MFTSTLQTSCSHQDYRYCVHMQTSCSHQDYKHRVHIQTSCSHQGYRLDVWSQCLLRLMSAHQAYKHHVRKITYMDGAIKSVGSMFTSLSRYDVGARTQSTDTK